MSTSCSCGFVIHTAIVRWCSFVHVCGWTPHTSELKNNCITKTGGRWVCSLWCAGAVQHPTVCQSHGAECSKVVQECLCGSRAGSVCISCTLSPCHIHLFKTCIFEQIPLANACFVLAASWPPQRRRHESQQVRGLGAERCGAGTFTATHPTGGLTFPRTSFQPPLRWGISMSRATLCVFL